MSKASASRNGAAEKCAGVLFRHGDSFLLLHSVDRDTWEGTAGHIEPGESADESAARETFEEIGVTMTPGSLERLAVDGNFTNFLAQSSGLFVPKLSPEHDAFVWATADDLPEKTHPNVISAIRGLTTRADAAETAEPNEMDVAEAIRDGELTSPQRVQNMWLFDLRVTGTGVSYRPQYNEYTYRNPAHYLNERFVKRCNGVPVIFEHPQSGELDTEEYRDRTIGALILPYQRGDEVWSIARIYDHDAAELMTTSHPSTSPSIKFRPARKIKLLDGENMLIEGQPDYIDHLAVCPEGVWDKGGEPNGVNA